MVLLSLLLQAQSVFACQMMDHSGAAEHCCCDAMKLKKDSNDNPETASPCCDFSSRLTLKGAGLEDEDPIVVQSQSSFELPPAAFILVLADLWRVETGPSQPRTFWVWDSDPDNPGTHTYLSTQRLRI